MQEDMVEISKVKKQRIFEGWFVKGDPRDGIAVEVDVSEGSVTNVVKEYEEEIGKPAADLLRKQAVARRKAGLKPEHVITEAMLAQEIGEAGIGSETARNLFKGAIGLVASSSPATLAGTTAEDLVKAAASVCKKASEKSVGIDQVFTLAEEEQKKHEILKAETATYVKTRDEAKSQQEKALMDADMTLGAILEYEEDKRLFGTTGMANRKKAAKIIERMNGEYGWHYSRMVEDFSANESLRQKNSKLESMITTNEERLKKQATIDSYHKLVEDVPPDLKLRIVARFNRMSVQEGMSPSMVWLRCMWDIDWCYHTLMSLRLLYSQKLTEYNKLCETVVMKRAQISFTNAQYDEAVTKGKKELAHVNDKITATQEISRIG